VRFKKQIHNSLVFDMFDFMLLTSDHSEQLETIAGKWEEESFVVISQRVVSSTNLTVSSDPARSLIMIRSKSGPSLVPVGPRRLYTSARKEVINTGSLLGNSQSS
jgi:hypothetical protein